MKIAICDDNTEALNNIVRLINKQKYNVSVKTFKSGKEMLQSKQDFDISFLDIAMKDISGIQLAKILRQKQINAKKNIIIFVTNYREYMEDAFDVNAYHYLIKPINEEKFSQIFKRAAKEVLTAETQHEKYIIAKTSQALKKVYLKDILYIESSNKKVIFHTKEEEFEVYGKMKDLEMRLQFSFYRCHRCYLVNMENISSYNVNAIKITNGDSLILAQKKYPDFVKAYMRYAKDGGIVNV